MGLFSKDEDDKGGAAGAAGMAGGPYVALIAAAAKIASGQMDNWADQAGHVSENRAINNIKVAAADAKARRYGAPTDFASHLGNFQQLQTSHKPQIAGLGAALQAFSGGGDSKSGHVIPEGGSQGDILKSDWFGDAAKYATADPEDYDLEDPWKVR